MSQTSELPKLVSSTSKLYEIQGDTKKQRLAAYCSPEKEEKLIEIVDDNKLEEIQEFVDTHQKECGKFGFIYGRVLPSALEQKQFKAYALLQSNFFRLSHNYYSKINRFKSLTEEEKKDLLQEIRKRFVRSDEFLEHQSDLSPLVKKLMLKTRLTSKYQQMELLHDLKLIYEKLEKMDEIRPILTVIAASEGLEVIFDYIEQYIGHVLPGKPVAPAICDFDSNLIAVSCSGETTFDGSSFIHECVHYLMCLLYENRGLPFARTDNDREEAYDKAFKAFESASKLDANEDLRYMKIFSLEDDETLEHFEHLKRCEGIVFSVTAYLEFEGNDDLIKRYQQSMAEMFDFYKQYTFPDIVRKAEEIEANCKE